MLQGACILLELWYNDSIGTSDPESESNNGQRCYPHPLTQDKKHDLEQRIMANTTNNAKTTRTTNTGTRKGPKPIQSVAQLRENLLRDAVAKEMKKLDRKIAVEERKRSIAHKRAAAANDALVNLNKLRAEFLAETGIKA
jgi:hypothetical protein